MAADSTGKVTPGSPFRAPPARVWNNMIDAGQAFADGRLSSGPPGATRPRATDLLRLKNSSGAVRRKGEILKIEGKVIETVTGENIWLDGIAPTANCRFGILKSPADASEVITAQVSGVCMALVNVTDAGHTFASAAGANYVLQSGTSGPLEILFAPVGTGELECVVRFAGGSGGDKIWFRVLEVSQYIFSTPGCEFVRALVTQVSCGSSVQVGDEVLVFDPHFCWFNIPIVVLMQFSGTASLAKRGTFDLSVCGVTVPDCFWAVDSACCLEETYA